jgi:hypothetical protein
MMVHHLRVGGSNARDGNGDGQGNNGEYLLHSRFPLERLSKTAPSQARGSILNGG